MFSLNSDNSEIGYFSTIHCSFVEITDLSINITKIPVELNTLKKIPYSVNLTDLCNIYRKISYVKKKCRIYWNIC